MATKKQREKFESSLIEKLDIENISPEDRRLASIVEFQVAVTARGRNVLIGTLLTGPGRIQHFKYELGESEKSLMKQAVAYMLHLHGEEVFADWNGRLGG